MITHCTRHSAADWFVGIRMDQLRPATRTLDSADDILGLHCDRKRKRPFCPRRKPLTIPQFSIYMATIDYMVASYGPYSASATGGNALARDFLAGVAAMYSMPSEPPEPAFR